MTGKNTKPLQLSRYLVKRERQNHPENLFRDGSERQSLHNLKALQVHAGNVKFSTLQLKAFRQCFMRHCTGGGQDEGLLSRRRSLRPQEALRRLKGEGEKKRSALTDDGVSK